ncbi:hypothetical protein vB_RpoS-V16_49 [Ruegeria phage vB_RpoS-V16]|uniref:tail assembly protein n=1 Tax=Ruegeria phage vB_RpoS-V16 TaxID=2218618 RepID=UPI000DCADD31|nr:tail assembly protein [Ruegeria phage vB_RpoS-V16]AWY09485.1 hypothetical protein vB_RpoS-V16_49 [Ruegeria phage vB_RpoS-V16]
MAFNDYETSRESGQPVELYLFVYGTAPGAHYAYTNAEQVIEHDGITYTPLPIERGKVATKGRAESDELTVEVPLTAPIANLFAAFPPGRVIALTIREGHISEGEDIRSWGLGEQFTVTWLGRVLESRRTANKATLTCENSAAGMKRVGLRRHYQYSCPLALYGSRCQADKEAAKLTGTVLAVVGVKLNMTPGWNGTNSVSDYIGGLVEWDSGDGREYRTILRVEGTDTIVLRMLPLNLVDGSTVDVFLGCPRTLGACAALHNNAVNYGGQPFIPTVNPVGKNNHT